MITSNKYVILSILKFFRWSHHQTCIPFLYNGIAPTDAGHRLIYRHETSCSLTFLSDTRHVMEVIEYWHGTLNTDHLENYDHVRYLTKSWNPCNECRPYWKALSGSRDIQIALHDMHETSTIFKPCLLYKMFAIIECMRSSWPNCLSNPTCFQ